MVRWVVAAPGPAWSVADVFTGWCEAFRGLGQDVHEFNLGDRLAFFDAAHIARGDGTWRKAVTTDDGVIGLALDGLAAMLWKVRPRILLLVSGFFWDQEMLEHARRVYGTRVIIHHTESPYENDRELQAAPFADLNLVNDRISVAKFAALAPSVYCPHAYRPAVHHPGPPVPGLECDLAFAGTGFPSRVWFLERMGLDGLDVRLAGNWIETPQGSPLWKHLPPGGEASLDNDQVVNLYRSMRCGINLYRRDSVAWPDLLEGHSMGPREVELAATGAFFLRDPRPESDRVLPMLPAFGSPEEASDLLRWWLDRPAARRETGLKAREAVQDRTFTNNAARLLGLLGISQ